LTQGKKANKAQLLSSNLSFLSHSYTDLGVIAYTDTQPPSIPSGVEGQPP